MEPIFTSVNVRQDTLDQRDVRVPRVLQAHTLSKSDRLRVCPVVLDPVVTVALQLASCDAKPPIQLLLAGNASIVAQADTKTMRVRVTVSHVRLGLIVLLVA